MLRSFAANNKGEHTVYVVTKEVTEMDLKAFQTYLPKGLHIKIVKFDDGFLKGAPTLRRWPKEIYYRIFAAQFLPETLNRILYLDSDIIINGDLRSLYETPFLGNLFVATTNIHSKLFRRFILWKNGATKWHVYANTGVLLMNLSLLRKEQSVEEVLAYVRRKKRLLTLPDQDIISTLYGLKIKLVDNKIYNLSEREICWYNRRHKEKIGVEWVEKHAKIIHYLSKNKPWKQGYKGILKPWYDKYKIVETAKSE